MSRSLVSRIALAAVVGAALASFSPVAAHAASRNLLINPGMEDALPDHPWMPAGWDTSVSGLPTTFFGRDSFLVHGGHYAVTVANVSTMLPMAHNWSQKLLVGREAWGKDAVFTVWTRSNGVDGRAYCLLQAYRDTISKMAGIWKVPHSEAASRLNIKGLDDPLVDFGWQRAIFTEPETDWVRRAMRVYVPTGTNVLFVRCGLLGSGQLVIDDASLTLENAQPAAAVKTGQNLLADAGFENGLDQWEVSVPPFPGFDYGLDSTQAHTGRASAHFEFVGSPTSLTFTLKSRVGVCQVISNRNLSGKRVRLSGWIKTDSLQSGAYLKIFAHGQYGVLQTVGGNQLGQTSPWTLTSQELDLPPDTYQVWAWCQYDAPVKGRVWFDDVSLEVLGPSPKPLTKK